VVLAPAEAGDDMSMNRTPIEWALNPDGTQGYSWNPITGCLKRCPYCYAMKLAKGRLRSRYLVGGELAPLSQDGLYSTSERDLRLEAVHDPFYPRLRPERLRELAYWTKGKRDVTKPKGIFVCDMSDLFGMGIPEEWTRRVLEVIKRNPQHRFYLLTKQPQNLAKFSPFPDHCYVGVTATDRLSFNMAIHELLKVEAKVKYISFEPLLFNPFEPPPSIPKLDDKDILLSTIKWVIIGAQTNPYKPPKIEWVREIIEACDKAGIPVFLKNNLGWPRLSDAGAMPFYKRLPSGTMELRQEMPNVK